MKTIDRYIGRQVFSSTAFAVLILSFVFVLGQIFKELLPELVKRPDMELTYVFQLIINVLPFSLIFTVPWGFLAAVLLVFGRLSANNELISLRMAGLSMTRICLSVIFLAFALTGLSLWLNAVVAPAAKKNVKGMVLKLATENPTALFNSDAVIREIPGYVGYVEEKTFDEETGVPTLKNLQLVELDEMYRPIRYVKSSEVQMRTEETDEGELVLVLDLKKARLEAKDADNPLAFDKVNLGFAESTPLVVSLEQLRQKFSRINPSVMSVGEIRTKLEDEEIDITLRTGLKSELSKRFSFSLACVTFGLIGIPLGVTAQRRETSIGFAISLAVAAVYFFFIILADTFRDDPSVYPHLLMWLPNVLFITLGGWLFLRLSKK